MATKSRLRLVAIAECEDCPYCVKTVSVDWAPDDWLACGHPTMAEFRRCPCGAIPRWCPLPVAKEEKPCTTK
jgi:hypothetical protein